MHKRSLWLEKFLFNISRSRLALIGLLLSACALPITFGLSLLILSGLIENPYVTIINNLILAPLCILGVTLLVAGCFFAPRHDRPGLLNRAWLQAYLKDDASFDTLVKSAILIFAMGVTSLFILGLLTYAGFHYSETTQFCGQLCHSVMHPEYSAYQRSKHSNVACVECHIGEGARWFVRSKLSGTRQIFEVLFKTYDKPIITPILDLRPAQETCQRCHRPEVFIDEKLVVHHRTLPDQENTPVATVLLMKVGSAGDRVVSPRGIHWHSSPGYNMTIEYNALDRRRSIIDRVVYSERGGRQKVYTTGRAVAPAGTMIQPVTRRMDCIDCHNRAAHQFLFPEDALDEKFQIGALPRAISYLKREALKTITRPYASKEAAMDGISQDLTNWFYGNAGPDLARRTELLDQAIAGAQAAYSENVFPLMNLGWGTYYPLIGHGPDFDRGCFRCHGSKLKSADGDEISGDCDLCHIVLAENEKDPQILRTLRNQ